MNSLIRASLICYLTAFVLSGCGPSDQQTMSRDNLPKKSEPIVGGSMGGSMSKDNKPPTHEAKRSEPIVGGSMGGSMSRDNKPPKREPIVGGSMGGSMKKPEG